MFCCDLHDLLLEALSWVLFFMIQQRKKKKGGKLGPEWEQNFTLSVEHK